MSSERKSIIKKSAEKAAGISKKVDKAFIALGSGIFILGSAAGAVIIIGSAVSIVPANIIERWARN